jgi:hypothetical protein
MSWIAAAVIVGGAGIASGIIGSQGAKSAASDQANAANNAAQIGWNEFNTITGQQMPYMQGGYGALNELEYGLGIPGSGYYQPGAQGQNAQSGSPGQWTGYQSPYSQMMQPNAAQPNGGMSAFQGGRPTTGYGGGGLGGAAYGSPAPGGGQYPTPSNGGVARPQAGGQANGGGLGYGSLLAPFTAQTFQQMSPAYQFQLQQGRMGVLNGAAAGEGALSGAALKDLTGYNQSLANTSFDTAFNQYQTQQGNIYNRLMGLTQLGENSAANTGAQGTNLAGQIGQSVTNAGSAQAAGQVGQANAWSGALSSAAPWLAYGAGGPPPTGDGVNGGSLGP